MISIDDDYSVMEWKDITELNRILLERLVRVEMAMLSIEMRAIREMEADIPPDPRSAKMRYDAEERLGFAEYLIQRLAFDPMRA